MRVVVTHCQRLLEREYEVGLCSMCRKPAVRLLGSLTWAHSEPGAARQCLRQLSLAGSKLRDRRFVVDPKIG